MVKKTLGNVVKVKNKSLEIQRHQKNIVDIKTINVLGGEN